MNHVWVALSVCTVLLGCGSRSPVLTTVAQPDSPATGTAVKASGHPPGAAELTYSQRRGKRLFAHYCAVCHGEGGAGDGFNAYNLAPTRPRDLTDRAYMGAVDDAWLREVIREGGRGTRRSMLMPAWGNTLTEDQIGDLVAFIRTLPH